MSAGVVVAEVVNTFEGCCLFSSSVKGVLVDVGGGTARIEFVPDEDAVVVAVLLVVVVVRRTIHPNTK